MLEFKDSQGHTQKSPDLGLGVGNKKLASDRSQWLSVYQAHKPWVPSHQPYPHSTHKKEFTFKQLAIGQKKKKKHLCSLIKTFSSTIFDQFTFSVDLLVL